MRSSYKLVCLWGRYERYRKHALQQINTSVMEVYLLIHQKQSQKSWKATTSMRRELNQAYKLHLSWRSGRISYWALFCKTVFRSTQSAIVKYCNRGKVQSIDYSDGKQRRPERKAHTVMRALWGSVITLRSSNITNLGFQMDIIW